MKFYLSVLFITTLSKLNAQVSDGTVQSVINADQYFNFLADNNGINDAYLRISSADALVFKSAPIFVKEYYTNAPKDLNKQIWKPDFAMIARSRDWAFTSGPYTYTNKVSNTEQYGHYLSVWRTDKKKIWKLALDFKTPHPLKDTLQKLQYVDADMQKYPRLLDNQNLKMRAEMVLNTDILLGKVLGLTGVKNFKEYYDPNVRMIVQGFSPIIGREKCLKFQRDQKLNIIASPKEAERALSGEIAYSYGTATIRNATIEKPYNYLRVWKLQPDMKWSILFDMYAERK